jgi:hypothetical protein
MSEHTRAVAERQTSNLGVLKPSADDQPLPAVVPQYVGRRRLVTLWPYLDSHVTAVPVDVLVKARRRVQQPRLDPDEPPDDPQRLAEAKAEALYLEEQLRELFTARNGVIVNEYYCPYALGGAVMTEVDRGHGHVSRQLFTVLNSRDDGLLKREARCARLFEDVTAVFGDVRHCEKSLRHSTDAIFEAVAGVLLAADAAEDGTSTPEQKAAAARGADYQAAQASTRANVALQREARFGFFFGVLLGTLFTIVVCAVLGAVAAHNWTARLDAGALVASTTFGALGAAVSVFQRMSSGRLVLDYTASRRQRLLLGTLRPLVGAVSGAIIQFILLSGILEGRTTEQGKDASFAFFAVVGFAAGFSERLATDMVERAGQLLEGSRRSEDSAAAAEAHRSGASHRGDHPNTLTTMSTAAAPASQAQQR